MPLVTRKQQAKFRRFHRSHVYHAPHVLSIPAQHRFVSIFVSRSFQAQYQVNTIYVSSKTLALPLCPRKTAGAQQPRRRRVSFASRFCDNVLNSAERMAGLAKFGKLIPVLGNVPNHVPLPGQPSCGEPDTFAYNSSRSDGV